MIAVNWLPLIPRHWGKIKVLVLLSALSPLAILGVDYYKGNLGFDPLDRITRSSGMNALMLLLASLTITPLRRILAGLMVRIRASHGKRLSDWNWLIKLRRMLGLLTFFYATLHLLIYFWLDQGASLQDALRDMQERPYLAVGMLAFVLLAPLAITANVLMMRKLGKYWRRLHRAVYLIAILIIVHYWMLTKVGVNAPLPFTLLLSGLLGWRIWYVWMPSKRKIEDLGMEISERPPKVFINNAVQQGCDNIVAQGVGRSATVQKS